MDISIVTVCFTTNDLRRLYKFNTFFGGQCDLPHFSLFLRVYIVQQQINLFRRNLMLRFPEMLLYRLFQLFILHRLQQVIECAEFHSLYPEIIVHRYKDDIEGEIGSQFLQNIKPIEHRHLDVYN